MLHNHDESKIENRELNNRELNRDEIYIYYYYH